MSSVSPWDTATKTGTANDFVTGGSSKTYAPTKANEPQPKHWVADENGQLVAVYEDDNDTYVPNTSHLPKVEEKQWHDGLKTHLVSGASAVFGLAAVAGLLPTVTPAQGMELLGDSTLLSGSRFLLIPILKTFGGIFRRR